MEKKKLMAIAAIIISLITIFLISVDTYNSRNIGQPRNDGTNRRSDGTCIEPYAYADGRVVCPES